MHKCKCKTGLWIAMSEKTIKIKTKTIVFVNKIKLRSNIQECVKT